MPLSILLPGQNISVNSKWGDLLGNISEQTDLADLLGDKADITHNHDTNYEPKNTNIQSHISSASNPHSISKEQVGLGFVTNEAQIARSIGTAKGDIISFSSSAVPLRLAVGTNGQVVSADSSASSGLKWITPDVSVPCSATLANCENSSTETTIVSLVIPANTINDKDFIDIQFLLEYLQNYGSSIGIYRRLYVNNSQIVEFSGSIATSTTLAKAFHGCLLQRLGNDLYVSGVMSSKSGSSYPYHAPNNMSIIQNGSDAFGSGTGGIVTSFNFAADLTFELRWRFATASSNIYVRPKATRIIKYKGS